MCWSTKPPMPMPMDKVKVNCDASVRGNGFVGIGFIIRDSAGLTRGAGVEKIYGNMSVM